MNIITINNLNFSYDVKKILDGINLNVTTNKLTGILGPNGCGKTTLLKNILGYLQSDFGTIEIFGKNSRNYSQKEKARILSLVPQKSNLTSAMEVEEFVLMGRLPHLENEWNGYTKEDREWTAKSLKELELLSFAKRIAVTLSGGEFQRVLLARAITQDTPIILLDEPTAALDLNHALELMKKLKEIIKNKGKTAVAVLHDLNLAAMFCDEIVMLKDGKVFCKGTPKDVFTVENLKEVYGFESEIIYKDNIPYIIPKI